MNDQVQKSTGVSLKDVLNVIGTVYLVMAVLGNLMCIFVFPIAAYREGMSFGKMLLTMVMGMIAYALPVPIAWKLRNIKAEDIPRKGEWPRAIVGIMSTAFGYYLYYFGGLMSYCGLVSLFVSETFTKGVFTFLMCAIMAFGFFKAGSFCIHWRKMKVPTEQLTPMQVPPPPVR